MKKPRQEQRKTASTKAGLKARFAKGKTAVIPEKTSPLIVGIGASAGGLEAFRELLGALSIDTGMAFVLVQHLEPKHESVLTTLLARATKMPVHEIQEGMNIEPNQS